jgi:hypothetical protein
MANDRRQMIAFLRRLGYTQAADEAERVLPDPVSMEQFCKFAESYGIARDEVISRMGGSP